MNSIVSKLIELSRKKTLKYFHVLSLEKNETVFNEGDDSTDLYIVIEGSVSVFKKNEVHKIATLNELDIFGDLSFLDGKVRDCTIRCNEKTSLLKINQNIKKSDPDIYQDLFNLINHKNVSIIRNSNTVVLKNKEKKEKIYKKKQDYELLSLLSILTISITVFFLYYLKLNPDINYRNPVFSASYVVLTCTPMMFFIKSQKIELSSYFEGLNKFKDVFLDIFLAVVVSVPIIIVLMFTSLYINDVNLYEIDKVINWERVSVLRVSLYFIVSLIQQLIRCSFQDSIYALTETNRHEKSVLLSSGLFSILHIHLGITACFLTFISGILFGICYIKRRSLIFLTMIHFFIGDATYILRVIM